MRELVPVVKCDRCDDPVSVETPSSIVTVNLAGEAPRRYSGENCSTCQEALEEALTHLLGDYLVIENGKALKKPRVPRDVSQAASAPDEKWTDAERTCPLPECAGRKPSRTRTALGTHLRVQHDLSLTDVGMAKFARKSGSAA